MNPGTANVFPKGSIGLNLAKCLIHGLPTALVAAVALAVGAPAYAQSAKQDKIQVDTIQVDELQVIEPSPAAAVASVSAGSIEASPSQNTPQQVAATEFPDAPAPAYVETSSSSVVGPSSAQAPSGAQTAFSATPQPQRPVAPASPFAKYIEAGQAAPRLTVRDKVVIGFKDSLTPFSIAGWIVSATYEEITDGPPNYGGGFGPYGQRVGAAAARSTSEGVFTAAVFSPFFHTDPRYYKLGDRYGTFHRIVYAASRTFITRTDGGRETLNASLLLGYLGGTSLTQAYYPHINRGFDDLARTYAESLLGASLSFTVSEFLSQALAAFHLQVPHFL